MSNHLGDANKMGKPETYMTIHADGRITVSDKLKPDETAARVLECMKTQFLDYAQATKIRELQDRIKRLEEALRRIANQDYRGNRSTESQIAFDALKGATL